MAVNAKGNSINAGGSIMESGVLNEQRNIVQDESGFRMQLDEIAFNQIDLRWGSYINPLEKTLFFTPAKPTIISHFKLAEDSPRLNRSKAEKQFIIYREPVNAYTQSIEPTGKKIRSFFELMISEHFFNHIVTEESASLMSLYHHNTGIPPFDLIAQLTPAMYSVINDMWHSPYSGHLKGIYLEAKAIELFLLQIKQLDQQDQAVTSKLKPQDVACLHEVKDTLELHYSQPHSITELARKAGINQMKLKNGFKELFGNTVFGYLHDIRMKEAKRLLLDEKMYVGEVAYLIGYKHPHHFTAAFRKKFGMLPRDLKN